MFQKPFDEWECYSISLKWEKTKVGIKLRIFLHNLHSAHNQALYCTFSLKLHIALHCQVAAGLQAGGQERLSNEALCRLSAKICALKLHKNCASAVHWSCKKKTLLLYIKVNYFIFLVPFFIYETLAFLCAVSANILTLKFMIN